jgi:uncharacterized protein YbjT (DUF2867 family)
MPERLIATTGSTGRLGGRVAGRLAEAGISQRLVVRDPARAPELPGSEIAKAEYGDGGAVEAALRGVDVVFMVSGSEAPDRVQQHRTFVDAAVAAGVQHLVYTSFYAAGPTSTFTLGRDHWATEEHIRASGLTFTFLRDNLYADFMPLMVGDDGVIRGPAGDGRVSAVAQDDIADVAATVLRAPGPHAGATYDLTGPDSLGLHEIAALLSTGLGRVVTYHDETLEEAYASRASYGAPDWMVDAWVSTYTSIAVGDVAGVSDDIPRILGRPATSVAELLERISGSDEV